MRKRNCRVQVRLTESEHRKFLDRVKRSGLTQEAYLRHLVNGVIPQDAPPPEFHVFMRELYRGGNNLNQIARKAYSLHVVDELRYEEAVQRLDQLILDLTEAVILPRRM